MCSKCTTVTTDSEMLMVFLIHKITNTYSHSLNEEKLSVLKAESDTHEHAQVPPVTCTKT